MSIVEISALLQSGVLSGLAVLMVYRAPEIWRAWLSYESTTRTFQAEQTLIERESRTAVAEKTMGAIAELTVAVQELRMASRDFCQYNRSHVRTSGG